MFRSARLKLTAWYLLIIMLISGFFSLIIYNRVVSQLEIGFNQIELRIRHMMPGVNPVAELLLAEQLKTAKSRVLFVLFSANGIILILSATAGYFLAGRTLKPIEETLKEQKRFVADASHELRTPLTARKTTLEVALRDKNLSVKEARKV
ncbi:MAG TPA: histidine kinase dimerization/phospho-acceptor domain-containing protein, partial [Candidatus Subteraquimicrobiales bacterium]